MSLREIADAVVPHSVKDASEASPARDPNGGVDAVNLDDGQPMIDARGVSVSLGGVEVLSDVTLTADRGQFVGLVGPNGAGKTTLLRALRATLTPDAGKVTVAGRRLLDRSARQTSRLVASVPQSTTLSFDFSVEETVEMGRTPHVPRFGGYDSADRRAVAEAMDRTDVAQFADRSITEVSGGERQRVLLARALAQTTPVLMLDEPTGSLDINHAVRTLELLRNLVDDGKTAVAAIHDLDLAARYCDELVLLSGGEIRAAGPPAEVLTAATLRETFDATTLVTEGVATRSPEVTPLSNRDPDDARVHVVGTGPLTAGACARLAAAGYEGSLGVAPAGDVAAETAADVDFEIVTVPAFAGIDDDARAEAARLADAADLIVVAGDLADANRSAILAEGSISGGESRFGEEKRSLASTPKTVVRVVEESDGASPGVRTATLADLVAVVRDAA